MSSGLHRGLPYAVSQRDGASLGQEWLPSLILCVHALLSSKIGSTVGLQKHTEKTSTQVGLRIWMNLSPKKSSLGQWFSIKGSVWRSPIIGQCMDALSCPSHRVMKRMSWYQHCKQEISLGVAAAEDRAWLVHSATPLGQGWDSLGLNYWLKASLSSLAQGSPFHVQHYLYEVLISRRADWPRLQMDWIRTFLLP